MLHVLLYSSFQYYMAFILLNVLDGDIYACNCISDTYAAENPLFDCINPLYYTSHFSSFIVLSFRTALYNNSNKVILNSPIQQPQIHRHSYRGGHKQLPKCRYMITLSHIDLIITSLCPHSEVYFSPRQHVCRCPTPCILLSSIHRNPFE